MTAELLYFANPMCSWCWGFAPVLREITTYWPDLRLTVATGTLGAERASKPMRPQDKDYVRQHWRHVVERTGQPFDFGFFDREAFVYDTAPSCRALAIIRRQYPALTAAFLHRMQECFYANNEDITSGKVLANLASDFGIGRGAFLTSFESRECRSEVGEEWRQTAQLGVSGYPTLLLIRDRRADVVTIGYRPFEEIKPVLERYLSSESAPA